MRKLHTEEIVRISANDFKESAKTPLTIVLDNIRSLHNVGSVFRTSDAYCIEEIKLCGITATPPQAEIHKTALGAEDVVKWTYHQDTLDAIKELKANNYTLVALEQCEGSILIQDFPFDTSKKYAIILGNEVKGVQQSVIDLCDACVELPQFGTKHSLNVSVAGGITIFEFWKGLTTNK